MLLPWLYWNYKVYGVAAVVRHKEFMIVYQKISFYAPLIIIIAGTALLSFCILKKRRGKGLNESQQPRLSGQSKRAQYLTFLLPLAFFMFLIPKPFLHSLQFAYVPSYSWRQDIFTNEPSVFYFGRLVKYSFI
jgi:hypothetical protein